MPRLLVIHAVTPAPQPTSNLMYECNYAGLNVLQPRVPQGAASLTTSASPSTTSDPPFFPSPSPPMKQEDDDGGGNNLAKSVLEYAVLAVGLTLVACFVLQRIARLKRANQPMRNFFSSSAASTLSSSSTNRTRFPRTNGLNSAPAYPDLFPPPAAYRGSRRVHALDIDDGGRRLGGGGEYDDLGDKDLLPAYEGGGGPPGYADVGTVLGYGYGYGGGMNGVGAGGRGDNGGGNAGGEGVREGNINTSMDTPQPEERRTDLNTTVAESTAGVIPTIPTIGPTGAPTREQPGVSGPDILDTARRPSG
ncbi:hypothetical protein Hypma_000569 [Hypsizygus marmoreus]|uniref:Uncharacterized protein n=1 Tax=Hypsizygus marmoreus TaxID=39966 RepID=A0A369J7W4_HYPMA|nr:hypothetical protein Hypma_000569 [Hypsizygus marmoreus]